MTLLQITAILSLLIAFGVDTPTVNHIHDLLIPPVASTTPIVPVPVVQTPIVQNAPVYFGSTAPVSPTIPPVVNNATSAVPTPTSTPTPTPAPAVSVATKPTIPFQVLGAEIMYAESRFDARLSTSTYLLRVFANLPISIASTTGMDGVVIGTPLVENKISNDPYWKYFSEAPLDGIPPQSNRIWVSNDHWTGDARHYHVIISSKDGQKIEWGLSVPY